MKWVQPKDEGAAQVGGGSWEGPAGDRGSPTACMER